MFRTTDARGAVSMRNPLFSVDDEAGGDASVDSAASPNSEAPAARTSRRLADAAAGAAGVALMRRRTISDASPAGVRACACVRACVSVCVSARACLRVPACLHVALRGACRARSWWS
jgi:hypothetical protein